MSADTNSLMERLPLLHGRVYRLWSESLSVKGTTWTFRHQRMTKSSLLSCWLLVSARTFQPLVIQLRPTPIPNHVAVLMRVFHSRSIDYERKTHLKRWWHEESSIRPTSVRMELNAPFSQEWAFCIDDTSLLSPLAARWFGIIPPSTVVTDFLSGNTMTFFLDYSVPPCRP